MPVLAVRAEHWRKLFPRASDAIIAGLVAGQHHLDKAGITTTRTRFRYCMANVEHECGGFTIPLLTENINYTHARMAAVWPNRFPGGAGDVIRKYGDAPGWQKKAFNDIYGNRMGNRPGTDDGSRFIGRGAVQVTGRDGYREVGKRAGLPLEDQPELASRPEHQAAIIAAFWSWKGLNSHADAGNWRKVVVLWNGGTNGLADREAKMVGNDPVITKLAFADAATPIARQIPGGPVPNQPPQDVVDDATKRERATRNAAGATVATGAGGEGVKAGIEQPGKPAPAALSPMITYPLIAVGVVVFVVAAILIARKIKAVKENWV